MGNFWSLLFGTLAGGFFGTVGALIQARATYQATAAQVISMIENERSIRVNEYRRQAIITMLMCIQDGYLAAFRLAELLGSEHESPSSDATTQIAAIASCGDELWRILVLNDGLFEPHTSDQLWDLWSTLVRWKNKDSSFDAAEDSQDLIREFDLAIQTLRGLLSAPGTLRK